MSVLRVEDIVQIQVAGNENQIKMRYSVVITSPEPEMHSLFLKENLAGDRCEVRMHKEKSVLRFEIDAEDSVALRATLNAITKLFTVYEKARSI